jgi:PAS domain S-box-containing protein
MAFDRETLLSFHCSYIIVQNEGFKVYAVKDVYRYFLEERVDSVLPGNIPDLSYSVINVETPSRFASNGAELVLVIDKQGDVCGVFEQTELFERFCAEMRHSVSNLTLQVENYKRIFDVMEDEVFITDEYGFIQYINPRGEYIMGIKAEDFVGCHVTELLRRNVLPKSLTLEVMKTGARCAEIVEVASGMKIICTAQPIFDKSGKMIQILSTSKHIEEITDKVKHLSLELSSSNEKIKNLQEQVIAKNRYIFESPPMRQIQKVILKIAPTDVSVLVEGESGVGKEVIADVIYHLSHRKDKPFIKINCGLIPKELMESELFGYEAGAFTGALKNGKTGKLEIANGGTVFFDEIGEMELPLQVKLLEFIQDRLIMRVGGTKRIPIDVRIIAATNKDLFTMVEQGTFRQDLYYRLNVMPLYIPPLRERREDIVPLIFHFLNMLNKKYGCDKHMDNSVVEKMQSYHWPGNVRELMHAIERIVVASESDYINSVSLDDLFMEGMTPYGIAITPSAKVICTGLMPLKEAKEKLEGNLVRMAYEQFGSSYKAAELLQVNQSTVNRWLKRVNDNANKHSV